MNYKFDEENGIIVDKATGERCIIVSKTRLQSIFESLSKIFKSGVEVLLKESSRTYGKNVAESAARTVSADMKLLTSAYATKFAQLGFGKMEICEVNPTKARMQFRVWNNFFAELRTEKSTYCK